MSNLIEVNKGFHGKVVDNSGKEIGSWIKQGNMFVATFKVKSYEHREKTESFDFLEHCVSLIIKRGW